MNPTVRLVLAIALSLGLLPGVLSGCGLLSAAGPEPPPATLIAIPGSDHHQIVLTARAAERIGVQTVPVAAAETAPTTVIPYSALLYDPDGTTFVYVNPEPLVFVRADVEVDRIEADEAFVTSGLEVGTSVVSVGAAELLGTESEIGH